MNAEMNKKLVSLVYFIVVSSITVIETHKLLVRTCYCCLFLIKLRISVLKPPTEGFISSAITFFSFLCNL